MGTDSQEGLRTNVPPAGEPKWTRATAQAAAFVGADAEAVYVVTKSAQLRGVGWADAKVRGTVSAPSNFRGKLLASGVVDGAG